MVLPGIVETREWNKNSWRVFDARARAKPCPQAIGGGRNSQRVQIFRVIVYDLYSSV
jgi:hypothetical protein